MSECLLPQTIKILLRIRILLSMRNLQWIKWDTVIYTKKICKSSYKMQRCFCFLLYFHFSFKRSFFYLSTYLFVFQLTSQKLVDQIVRVEKMFFLSFNSFVFLSNSQKKGKFIYFELHVSQVSVFDKTNITLNPGGGGGNSLYIVWYRRAAGIAPIFQVINTSIDHDFISNIHL